MESKINEAQTANLIYTSAVSEFNLLVVILSVRNVGEFNYSLSKIVVLVNSIGQVEEGFRKKWKLFVFDAINLELWKQLVKSYVFTPVNSPCLYGRET